MIQRPNAEWDPVDLQAVRDGRRDNGMKALMRSCSDHGAPYQVKTLPCNGQKIVVGQLGQLLVLAEPIDNLIPTCDKPDSRLGIPFISDF